MEQVEQQTAMVPSLPSQSSLYVGDLDFNVVEHELYEIFSRAGPVVSVRVNRNPVTNSAYAYVNYTRPEDAQEAHKCLNYSLVRGKQIRIMYLNPDPTLRKSGAANIFVKNLDPLVNGKILHDTFSVYGQILSCRVATNAGGDSKGYGFVQFDQEEAAANAIQKANGISIHGRQIFVGPFMKKEERESAVSPSKFNNVYIKNFTDATTDEDLYRIFGEFGSITSALVMRDGNGNSKGFGFVNFENPDDAARAVASLNGKTIDAKEWYVGRAQKKSERDLELKEKYELNQRDKLEKQKDVNVYVKNLDVHVDERTLMDWFSTHGHVVATKEDMSVPSSPGGSEDFAEFLDGELESTSDTQSHCEVGIDADNSDQEIFPRSSKKRKCNDGLEDLSRHTPVSDGVDNKCDGNLKARTCPPHPGYLHGLCIRCGSLKPSDEVADERNVALRYIHAGLEVSSQEAERIRSNELQKILLRKKLYLVLDLDHTLLNSARFIEVTSDENAYLQAVYLSKEGTAPELCKETGLYYLHNLQMWTKLRPFVHEFLKEASKLFELHLYTMGERIYAQTIANILDPAGCLFGSRVISQGESTCRTTKDLDVLLGAESAVIILDDTEAVWPKHKENLILMERYHFFGSSCKHFGIASASLMEAEKDESEDDGTLANTLKLLQHVHTAFFDGHYEDPRGETQTYTGERDVRKILHTIRSRVLAGCKVVFSRIFPTGFTSPETHPLWRLAEGLGATCSTSVDDSVTHIVAVDKGTDKAKWAQENSRHLVHPRWVEAALHTWRRPCEEEYSIYDAPSLTTFSKTVKKARPDPETT